MSFKDSLKKAIGIEEEYEDTIEEEASVVAEQMKKDSSKSGFSADKTTFAATTALPKASGSKSERRYSVANTSALKLVLIEPNSYNECPKLVESLKARRPVIINLENIEAETARQIFDFLNGAVYALNGNVQKITNNIFIFLPENVSVAGGEKSGFSFLGEGEGKWDK